MALLPYIHSRSLKSLLVPRSGPQGRELRSYVDMEFLQKAETTGANKLLGLLLDTGSVSSFH